MLQPTSRDADRFIPGIYNYCDRLCQACAFSTRCAVRDEELGGPGVPPPTAEAIARLLGTMQDADGPCDEQDDETDLDEAADLYTRIREDPIYVQAHGYAAIVDGFIRDNGGRPWRLHTDGRLAPRWGRPQAKSAARAAPPDGTALAPPRGTTHPASGEAGHGGASEPRTGGSSRGSMTPQETVLWFQVYIPGKVFRALYGLADADYDPLDTQSDANGSAKAALIAAARSREAWQQIVPSDARATSAISTIVGVLDHLRSELESRFPRAWAFIRPGFDEAQ